jgi:hypothetical protein
MKPANNYISQIEAIREFAPTIWDRRQVFVLSGNQRKEFRILSVTGSNNL